MIKDTLQPSLCCCTLPLPLDKVVWVSGRCSASTQCGWVVHKGVLTRTYALLVEGQLVYAATKDRAMAAVRKPEEHII
ncbi:hypothetical protein E2C01_027553 [Portunus trituberculatus]|uniref:Uncharacterized protein n=1 Tax=Portunus trituberculatus TaxID=210409 RepID=A0A5B7EJ10_PORTR|nr:hypothetical protein [Portunus trituberculatus]